MEPNIETNTALGNYYPLNLVVHQVSVLVYNFLHFLFSITKGGHFFHT
jgi:hypothetical protein